jgi:hypothetical protein
VVEVGEELLLERADSVDLVQARAQEQALEAVAREAPAAAERARLAPPESMALAAQAQPSECWVYGGPGEWAGLRPPLAEEREGQAALAAASAGRADWMPEWE